jgi:hypothetical protein
MFTKKQLELLEDLLNGDAFLPASDADLPYELSSEEIRELRGEVHTQLWNTARTLPKKDREAIEAARKAGITQIVGRNTEPQPQKASRLKPQAATAKTGDELLAILGL